VIEYMNRKKTAAARASKKATELDRLKSDRDQIRKWCAFHSGFTYTIHTRASIALGLRL